MNRPYLETLPERPSVRETVDVILEARDLHKSFEGPAEEIQVIRGIDLKVPRGKIIAIVGRSGTGKSTLLHLLGGLQRPSEGSVLFEGVDFYSLSEEKRAHLRNEKLGFVFQFYHLLPELSALENVVLPAMILRRHAFSSVKKEAAALLEELDLGDREDHHPNELSGGEQQRVAIARALMNRPDIVLCDEPTGNLDSKTGEGILRLMVMLNETLKTTFLIVTHAEGVAKIASKVFAIQDGRLEEKQ
ncbi:MAG: ABC transporter ATP-binding protein [Candidatus Omnitrophica bacterium]|nr:ABC transporter ATP-binding protein [Candidatus Omnitrophota bacterium]